MKPLGLAPHALDAPAFLGRGRGAVALFLGAPAAFDQWLVSGMMLNIVYTRGVAVRVCVTVLDEQRGGGAAHLPELMRWLSLDRLSPRSLVVDDRLSNFVTISLRGHEVRS